MSKFNNWIKADNKIIKKAYTHLLFYIDNINLRDESVDIITGEIFIPDGYVLVSSEPITRVHRQGSTTQSIKYNYVNAVDVEVTEYINEGTRKIGYPFEGTPLEKTKNLPKVLIQNQ